MERFTRLSAFVLISLISAFTTTLAFAARPGLYIGGQVGWGNVHDFGISVGDAGDMIIEALGYGNYTLSTFDGTNSDDGFAWRVFGGYQIGYNWAMEIGWAQFPRIAVDATAAGTDELTGLPLTVTTSSGIFKTTVFDFVGKYIYVFPWFCPMNVYGKFGVAFLTGKTTPILDVTEPGIASSGEDVITAMRLYPTASIGLTYDLRNDISIDLSYTRIQKIGQSEQLGSLDSLMLGMMLHFG